MVFWDHTQTDRVPASRITHGLVIADPWVDLIPSGRTATRTLLIYKSLSCFTII